MGSQLLAVGVVAAGLVAAPATGPRDPGAPPEATVRDVVLQPATAFRAAAGTSTAGVWSELAPVPTGDAVLVGAAWDVREGAEVELRARHDGEWDQWQPVLVDATHAPDEGDEEAQRVQLASDPIWIGPSDRVQVRTRGPVGQVDLTFVDMVGGAGLDWVPAELTAPAGAAIAATTQPQILSRASWGADESRRRYKPREWNRANFAIVHHTAGRNTYTPEEADDVIRSIYAYHLSKGWDDIAYNFLVDIYGRVWEGRAGGIDRPVVGGHAAGFNGGSVGVSAMGSFQVSEPPVAMLQAIEDLLAWKLDLHHLDPHGETEEIAGGGSSSRFAQGTRVTLPNIIGHRHTNNTSCPGDLLYEHVLGMYEHQSLADRVDEVGHPKAYGGPPQDVEQPLHGIRPRWDIDFTQPVSWQLAVVDAQGNEVRRGWGTDTQGLDLAWDMRDADGDLVEPGTYVAQLDAATPEGDAMTPVRTTFEVTPAAERRSGDNRIATSVELSSWAFDASEEVVLASAEAFPDALVAGPLAGSLEAPILLLPSDGVPTNVADEIRRLAASTAYIIGGASRIPEAVSGPLRAAGITRIVRLAGPDRFATSAAVAKVLISREHPTEALLALGAHEDPSRAFPDALAAGAFGADQQAPVLLVDHQEGVPGPILDVLASRPWRDGVVAFGGFSALPQHVVDHAAQAAGAYASRGDERITPAQVTRFAGGDRFDTARIAAEELLRRWQERLAEKGPSPYVEPVGLEVVIASGRNWPDALGASAAAANRGAVFLLVDDKVMERSEATRTFLRDHAEELTHALVSGGAGAVSEMVRVAVANEVTRSGPSSQPGETWPGEGPAQQTLGSFPLPVGPGAEPSPSPSATPSSSPSPSASSSSPSASPSPSASASPSDSASPSASPSDDPSVGGTLPLPGPTAT